MSRRGKERLSRKARFLADHPVCCYCGVAPSAEPDHCPAQVFFVDRVAPDGYEFPSCVPCNRATRNIEQVLACFIAMSLSNSTSNDRLARLFKHATNNMPGLKRELRSTFKIPRYTSSKSGLLLASSASQEEIFMTRTGPIVSHCIDIYGRKLSLALYYRHVGRPLSGFVFCRMTPATTNGEMLDATSAAMLSPGPLQRNRQDLSDVFRYEYALGSKNGFFAATIRLGDQLAYVTFAIPTELWQNFKIGNPLRAAELEVFGRPDIFGAI